MDKEIVIRPATGADGRTRRGVRAIRVRPLVAVEHNVGTARGGALHAAGEPP